MMIKLIFLKELQLLFLDIKYLFSFILVLLLIVSNTFMYRDCYIKDVENSNCVNAERLRSIENPVGIKAELEKYYTGKSPDKNKFSDVLFVNQVIIANPAKLSIISSDNSKLPDGISFDFFRDKFPEYNKPINEYYPQMIPMDWTNILLYFISILCIIFSYNAFTGEKELGTLKLMLVTRISRSHIIIGKYLSILFAICIPLILGVIISVVLFVLFPEIQLSLTDYFRILIFLIFAILFLSLNIFLGFFISIISSKSTSSLILGVLCWIILLVVLPSVSWIVGKNSIKIDNLDEYNRIIEHRNNEEVLKNKNFKFSWNSKWRGNPPKEGLIKRAAGHNMLDKIYNDTWSDYRTKVFDQVKNSISFSKLSPYYVFRFGNEKISNTGIYKIQDHYTQSIQYADNFRKHMVEFDAKDKESYHLIWNESWAVPSFCSQKELNVYEVPHYTYHSPELSELINSVSLDFLILFLWCAVLFFATFILFVKYDVR